MKMFLEYQIAGLNSNAESFSEEHVVFSQSSGLFVLVVLNYHKWGEKKAEVKWAHCDNLAKTRSGHWPSVLSHVDWKALNWGCHIHTTKGSLDSAQSQDVWLLLSGFHQRKINKCVVLPKNPLWSLLKFWCPVSGGLSTVIIFINP